MKEFLKKEIASGNRCYWVVSRVESDAEGMVGVSDVVEELKAFSSEWNVQGVHGQMDEKKRSAILDDFASGQVQVLVATTDGARDLFETSVACIGATTCQGGIGDSQGLLNKCVEAVRKENFKDGVLPKIHISGCPSSSHKHLCRLLPQM